MVFGSSQLGGDKELLQKLKLGTVDLALPSTVMSSEADLFGVFEMPYLVKDREHMQAHREGRRSGRSSRPKPRRRASRCSRSGRTASATSPTTSGRSTCPADLQGIKLRVPEGKWRVKMFQAYGANPSR